MNTHEEMAATLAHEFKNPLSLLTLNLDILQQIDETNKKYYDKMRNELKRLEAMTVDFLKMTIAGEQIIEKVNLNELVKNIVKRYTHPNIKFEFKEETTITTSGNYKKLSTIFDNIFKNAIEAIDGKEGTISIEVKENEITVKDSGGGFLEKPVYFTSKKENGTGVGLYLCSKIAEEHGAKFTLENGELGCVAKVSF
ncbi:MAG: HAMP domain-containing histidine kinase [Defluviitaleaceae bacterium]|nr:HAMP domain-containing histidine kinase [Defluviitaleaceae bacterium]